MDETFANGLEAQLQAANARVLELMAAEHELKIKLVRAEGELRTASFDNECKSEAISVHEEQRDWFNRELERIRAQQTRDLAAHGQRMQAFERVNEVRVRELKDLRSKLSATEHSELLAKEKAARLQHQLTKFQNRAAQASNLAALGALPGYGAEGQSIDARADTELSRALESEIQMSRRHNDTVQRRYEAMSEVLETATANAAADKARADEAELKFAALKAEVDAGKRQAGLDEAALGRMGRLVQHMLVNTSLAVIDQPALTKQEKSDLERALSRPEAASASIKHFAYFKNVEELVELNQQQQMDIDDLQLKLDASQNNREGMTVQRAIERIETLNKEVASLQQQLSTSEKALSETVAAQERAAQEAAAQSEAAAYKIKHEQAVDRVLANDAAAVLAAPPNSGGAALTASVELLQEQRQAEQRATYEHAYLEQLTENTALQTQLEHAQNKARHMEEHLTRTREKLHLMNNQLVEAQTSSHAGRANLEHELTVQAGELERARANLAQRNEDLGTERTKRTRAEHECEQLHKRLENLESQLAAAEAQSSALRTELDAAVAAGASLQAKAEERAAALQGELQAAQAAQAAHAPAAAPAAAPAELAALESAKSKAEEELRGSAQKISDLQAEIAALRPAAEQARELQEQLDQHLKRAQEPVKPVEKDMLEPSEPFPAEANADLAPVYELLQETKKEGDAAKALVASQTEKLETATKRIEHLEKEVNDAKALVASQTEKLETAGEDLKTAEEKLKAAEEKLKAAEENLKAAEEKLKAAEIRIEHLVEQVNSNSDEHTDDKRKLEEQLATVKTELEAAKTSLEAAERDAASAKAAKTVAEDALALGQLEAEGAASDELEALAQQLATAAPADQVKRFRELTEKDVKNRLRPPTRRFIDEKVKEESKTAVDECENRLNRKFDLKTKMLKNKVDFLENTNKDLANKVRQAKGGQAVELITTPDGITKAALPPAQPQPSSSGSAQNSQNAQNALQKKKGNQRPSINRNGRKRGSDGSDDPNKRSRNN